MTSVLLYHDSRYKKACANIRALPIFERILKYSNSLRHEFKISDNSKYSGWMNISKLCSRTLTVSVSLGKPQCHWHQTYDLTTCGAKTSQATFIHSIASLGANIDHGESRLPFHCFKQWNGNQIICSLTSWHEYSVHQLLQSVKWRPISPRVPTQRGTFFVKILPGTEAQCFSDGMLSDSWQLFEFNEKHTEPFCHSTWGLCYVTELKRVKVTEAPLTTGKGGKNCMSVQSL